MAHANLLIRRFFFAFATIFISTVALAATPNDNQRVSPAVAIGKIVTTQGDVLAGQNKKERTLQRGSDIYSNDVIATKDGATARLRFNDGAVLSLAPKSIFVVRDYVYNKANSSKDKFTGQLVIGKLRTITGAVAKSNRKNYKMLLGPNAKRPVAVIGVRGTEYQTSILWSESDKTSSTVSEKMIIEGFHEFIGFKESDGSTDLSKFDRKKNIKLGIETLNGATTLSIYNKNGQLIQRIASVRGQIFSLNLTYTAKRTKFTISKSAVTDADGNPPPISNSTGSDLVIDFSQTGAKIKNSITLLENQGTLVNLESGGQALIAEEEYNGGTYQTITLSAEDLDALPDIAELNETTSLPIHVFAIQDANNSAATGAAPEVMTSYVNDNTGQQVTIYSVTAP